MFWISILSAIGLAFILVEKSEDWPIVNIRPFIQDMLILIHPKMPSMLDCSVCTAFWAALIIDIFLLVATSGNYFLWPLTGFAASGIIWMFYQLLDTMEQSNKGEEDEDSKILEKDK